MRDLQAAVFNPTARRGIEVGDDALVESVEAMTLVVGELRVCGDRVEQAGTRVSTSIVGFTEACLRGLLARTGLQVVASFHELSSAFSKGLPTRL